MADATMMTKRIGVPYTVGWREFGAATPRGVLADALQDAGRTWEAELLRSGDPVVFGRPLRPPHAGDVAEALTLLVFYDLGGTSWLEPRHGERHDAVDRVTRGRGSVTREGWWVRWPSADTPMVYAVMSRLRWSHWRDINGVVRLVRRAGVACEVSVLP